MECLHNCPAGEDGSLNPDPISNQKCYFSHSFSDLAPEKFMSSLILRLEQQQKIRIHI